MLNNTAYYLACLLTEFCQRNVSSLDGLLLWSAALVCN